MEKAVCGRLVSEYCFVRNAMSDESKGFSVDLSGQVAVVTGAAQGLGRAMAECFARAGAKIACMDFNPAKLPEATGAIEAAGGVVVGIAVDVTDSQAVQAAIDAVLEKWGRIDILINNAGITRDTLVPRMSDEEWDAVINTNLRGTFLMTRAVSRPMMQARYGRIINISSVSGIMGNPGQSNYGASKAGVIGFTRTVAKELAKRKITVNAIAPGFIESAMSAAIGDELLDEARKRIPAKRLGKPEEVADLALFLASDGAAYLTGQVITLDGGMTC